MVIFLKGDVTWVPGCCCWCLGGSGWFPILCGSQVWVLSAESDNYNLFTIQIFLKLQGRWGASKFSVERFYSSLNVYPESAWSVSAAGSLGWTDRDKGRRASAPGAAQPTTFSVFPSALGSCPVWANWVKMPLMWPRWLFQLHVSALTLCLDSEVWRAVVLGALVSVGSKQLTDLWCPSLRVCEWTVCARPCVGPVTARGCIFLPLPRWKQWLYNRVDSGKLICFPGIDIFLCGSLVAARSAGDRAEKRWVLGPSPCGDTREVPGHPQSATTKPKDSCSLAQWT